jgi:hypothetical protein
MLRLFTIVMLLVIGIGILQAQETERTPTPAPSKTPMANAEIQPEATVEAMPLLRPFVQDDLNVLVGNVQRPNAISWLNGKLYIVCNGDWTIYEVDAITGATITFISGIRDAHQVYAEDTDDGFNLWIPDFETNQLMLVTHRRSSPRMIANDGLNAPWGIIPFNDEQFIVSNLKADNLVLVSREGEVTEIVDGLRSPAGLAGDDEFVYFANNGSARRAIEWFTKADVGEATITPKLLVGGLQNVSGLTMGADGYLYFAYSLGNRGVVGRVQPDFCRESGCTNEQVEVVLYTELPAPLAGLTVSPDMTIFVHTIYRPELYRLDLTP